MEEIKYHGNFVKVTEEKIDGNTWERVYLQSGVQVFPMNAKGQIYLIEEKRPHEKNKIRLKFVTGLMDKEGEDPLETANREMQEEIGLKGDHLEILLHREATGTINNHFYQVLATGLKESKIPNPDGEDTIVSIKTFSISEIELLLEKGELPWSMGALGIFKIKQLLAKNLIKF
ncbi:MAG: NUDIX hydrolase [Halobacteriovoraceae bacterium]|jgi:ADP-ribose pyrophosphatase YjhB (NUDIX family)|nr:NUDIX hydrolase [Halobacteriovoraceae bacterium]